MECKAGEFVWREAGSRHVAWCPNGALILAIFQVPNKFFEADGVVVDAAGQDWDAAWGHTGKSLRAVGLAILHPAYICAAETTTLILPIAILCLLRNTTFEAPSLSGFTITDRSSWV